MTSSVSLKNIFLINKIQQDDLSKYNNCNNRKLDITFQNLQCYNVKKLMESKYIHTTMVGWQLNKIQ